MKPIAFLVSADVAEPGPDAREDAWEYERERDALQPACAAGGFDLIPQIWDRAFDAAAFEAAIVGPCWDYMEKPDLFWATLERIAGQTRLFNPLDTLIWSGRKTYLKDLEARGARIVPTLWFDRADAASIAQGFDRLGADQVVVKPVVGASAWRQARLRRGEPIPPASDLPLADCMIQPFIESVPEEGEYSFLFFDRVYSHCVRKAPAKGDYRVQSLFGAQDHVHQPAEADLAAARAVLEAVEGDLLYARVDMVRLADGGLAVMELELLEPYLYPKEGPDCGTHFAAALGRFLQCEGEAA